MTTMETMAMNGVIVKMIDLDLLKATCTALGYDVSPAAKPDRLAMLYTTWLQANPPKNPKELGRCTKCKGISSSELDKCPFCGHDEQEEGELDVTELAVYYPHLSEAAHLKNAERAAAAEAEAQKEKPVKVKKEKPAAEAKPAKAKKETDDRSSVAEQKTEAQMTTTTATNGTSKAMAKAEHKETKPAKVTEHKAELVYGEKDLDTAVNEIQKLKGAGAVAYWMLGAKILEVYDKQLWKQRTEDGKPRWKTFDAFCHNEVQMTPAHAYQAMDVAKYFTKEQCFAWGSTKLGLVLQAPAEDRERIQREKVEKGATVRQVKEEVNKSKKDAAARGETKKDRLGRKSTGSNFQKGAKPKKGGATITVAAIVGKGRGKAFYAEDMKKPEEERRLCKRLQEVPSGVIPLANGVNIYVKLREGASSLVFEWDVRRDGE